MRTFKKDIFRVFIIVIIINILAFLISINLQSFYIKNFYDILNQMKYDSDSVNAGVVNTNSKYIYELNNVGEQVEFCITPLEFQTESDFLYFDDEYMYSEMDATQDPLFCTQGIGASIIFSLPFIFYFTIFTMTALYFVYKIAKIFKEMNKSLNNIKDGLNNAEIYIYDHKYEEMKEISDVVYKSIYMFKRNELLEKELINSIVHDIKTPLHIINGYNDMQIKNSNSHEFNLKIKEQTETINSVIDETLDNNYFKIKQVDVLFIIKDLLNDYKIIYTDIVFEIVCDFDSVYFDVDIITFKRIIINIIDNAIEASTNKKEIKIYISNNTISIVNYGSFTQEEFEKYIKNEEVCKKGLGLKIIYNNCLANNLDIKYEVKELEGETWAVVSKVQK